MPAPQNQRETGKPVLGHVNLMVDTFLANTNIDDLRAIVRRTLATNSPSVASSFTEAARERLIQVKATTPPSGTGTPLFIRRKDDGLTIPDPELHNVLIRARSLYGAGLGLASLRLLAAVVRGTKGHRWEEGSHLESIFAEIDADISQGLQSSREEIEGGRVPELGVAREAIEDLRTAIKEIQADVETWGGVFPFDRAAHSLDYWKL
ncbi:hypothetical protein K474DRAFT_1651993 [Panus rudis PR-1116 ss-1]|nr:hypothetical protein K474DRAFT_1651993 [Panus rudis PR-1116 ss-1]